MPSTHTIIFSDKEIEKAKACRICLKSGVIDVNVIDSILEKIEKNAPPPSNKKKSRRAELRARFERDFKMQHAGQYNNK